MGSAPLLTLLPLFHRSLLQHLCSQVLPFAALQPFKKPVSAMSHALLVVQLFVNAFVDEKTKPVVTQRSRPGPQVVSV